MLLISHGNKFYALLEFHCVGFAALSICVSVGPSVHLDLLLVYLLFLQSCLEHSVSISLTFRSQLSDVRRLISQIIAVAFHPGRERYID